MKRSRKRLGLFPLPVEVDADGYVVYRERSLLPGNGSKKQLTVRFPVPPQPIAFGGYLLTAAYRLPLGAERSIQREIYPFGTEDAYMYFGFFHVSLVL